MQDNRDGEIHGLDSVFIDAQRKMLDSIRPAIPFAETRRRAVVAAGEAKGIPEKYQGPVFVIGEELTVKGGRFRVERFRHGKMLLKGLPKIEEEAV